VGWTVTTWRVFIQCVATSVEKRMAGKQPHQYSSQPPTPNHRNEHATLKVAGSRFRREVTRHLDLRCSYVLLIYVRLRHHLL